MINRQTYNNMNKLFLSIMLGIVAMLLILVMPSYAKDELGLGRSGTVSAQGVPTLLRNPVAQSEVTDNLRKRADLEITRRVTSLTELITRINGLKKLSQTNKTGLINNVQEEITNLNNLKTKIDADTDLTTLRTDVKSIVQSYRVYAFYIPQIRILAAADVMSTTADNLTVLSNKLQTLITSSGATGATLTSLQNFLSDMNLKIKEANDIYQSVETEVLALTPAGYPANKTTLVDARSKLKTGAANLKTARDDAKQIVKDLRVLKKVFKATGSAALDK